MVSARSHARSRYFGTDLARGELGFAHERAHERFVLGQVGQQTLQRNDAFEAFDAAFLGPMNGRHAADAQAFVHLIRTEELAVAVWIPLQCRYPFPRIRKINSREASQIRQYFSKESGMLA